MSAITPERLRSLLDYCPNSGLLTFRVSKGRKPAGSVAGTKNFYGYIAVMLDGRLYRAHRLIWLHVHGEWPDQIDHINGVRDDNRLSNLRSVPLKVNNQNYRKPRIDSASGIQGITARGSKWQAQLTVDGKNHWLGNFPTREMAHQAYLEAKRQLHEGCTL